MFSIPKDEHKRRQILNAMPGNSRAVQISDVVHTLGCAFDLVPLLVKPPRIVLCSEDLSDFYHQLRVSAVTWPASGEPAGSSRSSLQAHPQPQSLGRRVAPASPKTKR